MLLVAVSSPVIGALADGSGAQEGGDRLAVGLPLRRLHDGADEDARGLHLAASDLLDHVRVGGDRLIQGCDQTGAE